MIDKEEIQKEAEKRYPLDYGKNGNATARAERLFIKQEIFKKGVEWALKQVKNNGVLDDVISRFLVVYDNESKKYLKMETVWSDTEVESVEYESGFRWRVVSEHKNEKLALNKAEELNNGL